MNIEALQPFLDCILVLGLCSSRIVGFCTISVFFTSQYLSGTARRAAILALSLITIPCLYEKGTDLFLNEKTLFFFTLFKEIFLGIILGWLTNFIFYVAQSVGFIIDTQRGASMASMFDPLSNSQTSPLGDFLMKFVMTLAILSGGFLFLLKGIYLSYELIPVFIDFDFFKINGVTFFNKFVNDNLFQTIALLGGPVLFILFLAEFGLGLVTRFAPQLNVFFLSMPIKSELAMFFFILYLSYLARYFCGHFEEKSGFDAFFKLFVQ